MTFSSLQIHPNIFLNLLILSKGAILTISSAEEKHLNKSSLHQKEATTFKCNNLHKAFIQAKYLADSSTSIDKFFSLLLWRMYFAERERVRGRILDGLVWLRHQPMEDALSFLITWLFHPLIILVALVQVQSTLTRIDFPSEAGFLQSSSIL